MVEIAQNRTDPGKQLPDSFRVIRLELAREQGHPDGDARHGYDLLAPLDNDGKISGTDFRSFSQQCRVHRFRPNQPDAVGRLAHGPGGAWLIDYGNASMAQPERGFHFADEHFRVGEYVSIREDDGRMHTFKVKSVRRP